MQKIRPFLFLLFFIVLILKVHGQSQKKYSVAEKTSFQVSAPWKPEYDVRSDIAMVYGMDSTFNERVKGYRKHGYNVQFMTGIAWGNYQDYFTGKYDGKTHDEGRTGRTKWK